MLLTLLLTVFARAQYITWLCFNRCVISFHLKDVQPSTVYKTTPWWPRKR